LFHGGLRRQLGFVEYTPSSLGLLRSHSLASQLLQWIASVICRRWLASDGSLTDSTLFHPQTFNGPINHRLGDLQQMPNRKHHRPVGTLELVATLIRRDRSATQQVGDIELRVFKAHVFADVVEAQFIRWGGLIAGEVEINGAVEGGTVSEQVFSDGFVSGGFGGVDRGRIFPCVSPIAAWEPSRIAY
jgi:hypothetical protein